jgi:hypothetical protein
MSKMTLTAAFLIFISLGLAASAQSYMGTVSTGTGIIPSIAVGSGKIVGANVGAASTQANLSGTWSLDLKDSLIRHLEIEAFQNQDVILGTGDLTAAGTVQSEVVAGSVSSERVTLFVSAVDGSLVYVLDLSSSGNSVSGSYDAYTPASSSFSGTVTGTVNLVADRSAPTVLGGGSNPAASTGAYAGSSVAETSTEKSSTSTHISYGGIATGDTAIGTNYG